ncbi:MAG: ferrous iron transport protein [Eubacteriales bacterium]|nr:ferrous iron transport protein [Eubacteriales bacterium]
MAEHHGHRHRHRHRHRHGQRASSYHDALPIEIPPGARKIVLAGNPNVGKSVFFNALTGLYVDVSNYPGTTLDISHGRFGKDVVIDTPGVYGISSFNDEERIARDIILSADLVLNVVSAVHLERDLFLTQQIIDTGVPVIVALNMVDEARRNGREVDHRLLSRLLGVPVIPTIAVEKVGLEEVKQQLFTATPGQPTPGVAELVDAFAREQGIARGDALLILEGDPVIAARHGLPPGDKREEIYRRRRERVNWITSQVVKETEKGISWSTRIGRWMLRPLTGIPLLILTLWAMYQVIGVFIAQTVVGFTEETVMQGYYEPAIKAVVGYLVSPDSVVGQILIGEFGLLTMTVTYIFGLLLPLVLGFYLVLSLLEDSGYLPRIAALLDRLLTGFGLNGRAVIPIILGFGCVTMATITTRLLGSERERRIATFLLGLAIPCSAQLAVIISLLAGKSWLLIFLYVMVIFAMLVIAGTALNMILPGQSTELLIDLPPVRLPRPTNVLRKTYFKTKHFLTEATPLFAGGSLLISLLDISGGLKAIQQFLRPLTEGWLLLPKEVATAFIMGFVRRDFGAAGLYHLHLSDLQVAVALITITLFVPCIASTMVIFKERGRKEGLVIWPVIITIAFIVGGIVSRILHWLMPYGLGAGVAGVAAFFLMLIFLLLLAAFFRKRVVILKVKTVEKQG